MSKRKCLRNSLHFVIRLSTPSILPWMTSWCKIYFFYSLLLTCLFLAVQNSPIGLIVRPLLGRSGTTNNQSLHNIAEWPQRLVTFETFDHSDEETWPDQHFDIVEFFWKLKSFWKFWIFWKFWQFSTISDNFLQFINNFWQFLQIFTIDNS